MHLLSIITTDALMVLKLTMWLPLTSMYLDWKNIWVKLILKLTSKLLCLNRNLQVWKNLSSWAVPYQIYIPQRKLSNTEFLLKIPICFRKIANNKCQLKIQITYEYRHNYGLKNSQHWISAAYSYQLPM